MPSWPLCPCHNAIPPRPRRLSCRVATAVADLGPELPHCYDIPALPPDNLRLEGVFGSLRRRQRRISGVASTRPLRALGQFQVLFAADTQAELLDQLRSVPYAHYMTHRRCLAEGEAGRQHLWRLHRNPAGTIAALLQQHATRRGALAAAPSTPLTYTD